jgi:5-methylcytosine-specific restriction endonuclease McrA
MLARKKAERAIMRAARPMRRCPACSREFQPFNGHRKYCSERCTRKTLKRIDKGIRRARKRAVSYEAVDPIKVFNRDGWRCQLCGRKTLRQHKNTPDSPELDHIVPLALGGEHTYINTQCLCRDCNGKKGARMAGQLRLVG